jgi:hypothetical protein
MRNARITSYRWYAGGLLEADTISVSRKVHNTNSTSIIFVTSNTDVEYLAFLSQQGKNGEL